MKELNYEYESDQWYLAQYLTYGSVEEVYKRYRYDLRIPIATYHRLVKNYGIVKSVGRREVSLSEVLYFFVHKALQPTIGIETLYYEKMPPSFQTSVSSLHRIYNRIVNRTPQRFVTALIIQNGDGILLGQEMKTQRFSAKYAGDWSLPMTFSAANESNSKSILRVLQQEVLTNQAIEGKLSEGSSLSKSLIPQNIEPFLYFDILDLRVSVFELKAPTTPFSSYKLTNHTIFTTDLPSPLRMGMAEITQQYFDYKKGTATNYVESNLNRKLLSLA